ncbi:MULTISPECIES: hypothetical protein [Priestia]|uniref:hypothetical protein n=1 Tax=Priestia TaxID=2800373 RepID=UPI00196A94B4|nr:MULTISPECIES: hypothetical protein [Priestia]MCE4093108.1 hypothetical protein [Priestia megaterium]MED3821513.1 hypothetical protein [Priestia aryabhattai]QSF42349.1 hypothetical protein ICR96_30405 [Priestia megaterium]
MKKIKKLNIWWTFKRQAFYSFFALPLLSKSAIGLYYFIMENLHNEIQLLTQNINFRTFIFTLIVICIFELMQLPPGPPSKPAQ